MSQDANDFSDDGVDEQSRQVARSLEGLILISRRTRRSLEEELGLGSAGLSKILNGTVRLQMSHVFLITRALGVDPGQFFQWAVPAHGPRSPLIAQARGEQPDEAAGLAVSEFDSRVKESLARLLGFAQA